MARVSWRKSHRRSWGGSDQELIPTLALLSQRLNKSLVSNLSRMYNTEVSVQSGLWQLEVQSHMIIIQRDRPSAGLK